MGCFIHSIIPLQGSTIHTSSQRKYFLLANKSMLLARLIKILIRTTVDSRYLEFDGTMEKIRVNRSSTQEELQKYRKCSLFNDERETTRANFEELKPALHVPILGTILNIFDVSLSLLNFLNLVERLITSRYLFCVYEYVYLFCLCFSAVALSLNFAHNNVFFFVQ